MDNLKISIPKPCHENWNAMTTAAQGRFCSSCNKTVIDFSDKTETEVSKLIGDNRDKKLCGRFRNDQLTEAVMINISIDALRQKLKPYQAFAIALLLAFGTTLFSCTTPQGNVVGELALVQKPDTEKVTTIETVCVTMGSVLTYSQIDSTSNRPAEGFNNTIGDVMILEDTVQLNTVEVSDKTFTYDSGMMTLGEISICPVIENPGVVNEADSITARQVNQLANTDPVVSIYPNPSSGAVNLKLNFEKESNLKVDLYDLNGSLVRNIIPYQSIQAELKDIPLNISELPAGIYLLIVTTDEKNFSEKIVITK